MEHANRTPRRAHCRRHRRAGHRPWYYALEPGLPQAGRGQPQCGPVIFDAAQCEYLDSTFLGCLIGLQKKSEQSRGHFSIAASHETQLKLFSLSSLYKYFDFVEPALGDVKNLERVDIDALDAQSLGRHVMQCHGTLAERGGREAPAFRRLPTVSPKNSATRRQTKRAIDACGLPSF